MYRDKKWKFVRYHDKEVSELYDLVNDPWEHRDLSDYPDYRDVLLDLMRKSSDATALAYSKGQPRVNHY